MKHDVIAASTPHVREIVCWEPAGLARRLRGEANLTLLESVQRLEHLGRYSFLACNPSATLTAQGGQAFLNGVAWNVLNLGIALWILYVRNPGSRW